MDSSYLLRSGVTGSGPYEVQVTPESAGWGYSSLKIISLEPGGTHRFQTGPDEVIVLPLNGAVAVDVGDVHCELEGRASVFDGPSDVIYVGSDPRMADGLLFAAPVRNRRCDRATLRHHRCRSSCEEPASPVA
jgi:5-deoxy-D-glucuronate isomerase